MKRRIVVLALFLVLLFGLAGWRIPSLSAEPAYQPVSALIAELTPAVAPGSIPTAATPSATLKRIYAQVSPSVVIVHVAEGNTSGFARRGRSSRFGSQGSQAWDGLGSGFVWDTNGDIVTNNHVVAGATRIGVTFADGTSVAAQVVATDPASDLAVIKVSAPAGELRPVTLADSTQLKIGQPVIAIGNPFGQQNKMTTGTVTDLEQSLPASDGITFGPTYVIPDLIQTDAQINPGNSGGVLLDSQGRVIGVTNAIESPTGTWAGVGFAISSATVQKVVPALIQTGHVDHAWLGVSSDTVDPYVARQLGLAPDQTGAVVIDVVPGSPADQAGLTADDVIVAVDGQKVQGFDDVISYLARASVGQTVNLSVLRDGQTIKLNATLGSRPAQ